MKDIANCFEHGVKSIEDNCCVEDLATNRSDVHDLANQRSTSVTSFQNNNNTQTSTFHRLSPSTDEAVGQPAKVVSSSNSFFVSVG